jgi:hypothetical protein
MRTAVIGSVCFFDPRRNALLVDLALLDICLPRRVEDANRLRILSTPGLKGSVVVDTGGAVANVQKILVKEYLP